MNVITSVIYIVLFIIMMIFVFSIGMLRKFMPKKEMLLVILVAFLIGSIGGAMFLEPIYREVPAAVDVVGSNLPMDDETLYLDLSSSINVDELKNNLSSTEGFKSFEETSVTIPLWSFNEQERAYFEQTIGNIDPHFKNYTIDSSGNIEIQLEDNYTAKEALKSFSDWYKLVYGETISYAQVHAKVVVASNSVDTIKDVLLKFGVVPSKMEGPVQERFNETNSSLMSSNEFVLITGGIGVVVAVLGIFHDGVVVFIRKINRLIHPKNKR